jgi:hypothetical protein
MGCFSFLVLFAIPGLRLTKKRERAKRDKEIIGYRIKASQHCRGSAIRHSPFIHTVSPMAVTAAYFDKARRKDADDWAC